VPNAVWQQCQTAFGTPRKPGVFVPSLSTAITGNRSVAGSTASDYYISGTAITLTATANPGSTFTGWT